MLVACMTAAELYTSSLEADCRIMHKFIGCRGRLSPLTLEDWFPVSFAKNHPSVYYPDFFFSTLQWDTSNLCTSCFFAFNLNVYKMELLTFFSMAFEERKKINT